MPKPAYVAPLLFGFIAQPFLGVTGCSNNEVPKAERVAFAASALTIGNGKLEPGESCDDGNKITGDGCSSTGATETNYYCWVPGNACSLKTACGNGTIDSGETCDNGATAGNSCSASCDFTNCGNGVRNNGIYPDWSQEICDDGNRYDGDGCNRLCEVESGWACSGTPSRCAPSGVVFYNTGVGNNFRALAQNASDPHWKYSYNNTSAVVHYREATDWPRSLQGAQYVANATGTAQGNGRGCVYQDFQIPSTYIAAHFTLIIAAFNDNNAEADSGQYFAKVNGTTSVSGAGLLTLETPTGGQAWQKNIIYALTASNPWVIGLNRVELCNDDLPSGPTGFRYSFADATDGRCGDGTVSSREQCDDGNTTAGDGCSVSCDIESGYGCVGSPSKCALTCGNGILNPGEQCDDGNKVASDGCSAACRIETGYTCATPGSICVPICGDGKWVAGEQCDDGNTTAADGCSPSCRLMPGWECSGSPGGISTCSLLCGNSQLDSGELCDDGGRVGGDGCSVGCTIELGWACPTVGSPCAKTCGNAIANAGEQCDDGNTTSGDGCNAECSIESGWICPAAGACTKLLSCGNGALNTGETCDDGNIIAADGCNVSCQVEPGWQCSGTPSVCATVCGDSSVAGAETCDDGNLVAGDGCGNACRTETGYACVPPSGLGPSSCAKTCGNGAINAGEQCDDGNTTNGDGCTGSCKFEAGWECLGPLGPCCEICGNGIRTPSEECDDGNLVATDTCNLLCKLTGTGNGAPRITTLSFSIAEGSVGPVTVLATDPNSADVLTFSLVGGDDASQFTLNATSGQLTFKSVPDFESPLDVNRDNEYAIRVSVSDGNGGTDSQTLYMRVTNQTSVPTGGGCSGAEDCTSGVCDGGAHTCLAPTCSDAVKNALETDVDCGGGTCSACGPSKLCALPTDCLSHVCDSGTHQCLAPTCVDAVKNAAETDVDCGGGTCPACANTRGCLAAGDCGSGVCDGSTHLCLAPTCSDAVHNGSETDVDCGGGTCPACSTSGGCLAVTDCSSGVCDVSAHLCLAPNCSDLVRNGTETDVDCGGSSCPTCGTSKLCALSTDCISLVCESGAHHCLAPVCSDAVKNGIETDVDCGGGICQACSNSKGCVFAADCLSGVCDATGHVCLAPTCGDGIKNGTETDVDCGGSTCSACADDRLCLGNTDCRNGVCDGATGHCLVPTCTDHVKNAAESDVDCGGSTCQPCENANSCNAASDCRSNNCSGSTRVCVAATCIDGIKNASETDVDCGGPCSPCIDGKQCLVGIDCSSHVCDATLKLCSTNSCGDSTKNGNETDVDCGGSACPPCANGKICSVGADCNARVCEPTSKLCVGESCTDAVKNGTETDVDCGGVLCSACATGRVCAKDVDCLSKLCNSVCIASGPGGNGGGAGQAGAAGVGGAQVGSGGNAGSAGRGPLAGGGSNGGVAGAEPTSTAGSPAGSTVATGGSPQGGTVTTGGSPQVSTVATGGNATTTTLSPGGTPGFGGNAATGGSVGSTVGGADQSLEGGGCNCAVGQRNKSQAALLTLLLALGSLLRRRRPNEGD